MLFLGLGARAWLECSLDRFDLRLDVRRSLKQLLNCAFVEELVAAFVESGVAFVDFDENGFKCGNRVAFLLNYDLLLGEAGRYQNRVRYLNRGLVGIVLNPEPGGVPVQAA